MEYVQAQFSLKFEPQIKIRRSINQIEDFLVENYGAKIRVNNIKKHISNFDFEEEYEEI